jgi:putative ABC transport system permease protein
MRIGQVLLEAFESLSANKGRSALTMLGIVIGVAAVVAMLAIGAGAQSAITGQIESIGVNLLYVLPGGDATNPKPLTLEDAQAMADPNQAATISQVAPAMQGEVETSVAGENTFSSLMAVTPEFFVVQKNDLTEGHSITQANVDDYASVALIGSETAEILFDTTSGLVGKTIRLNGQIFRITGVLKEQGGNGFGSTDNRVIVPLSTAQLRLLPRPFPDQIDMIYVQASSSENVPAAMDDVSQILRARHRIQGDDDFQILSTQSFLDIASSITNIMTIFLGGIAGVSLLVGGIGIMNIMLVTVTERTREIGLRKAVGARRRDIRFQFLVESSFLSLGGGLIGVLLGWGIGEIVGRVASAANAELDPQVTLQAVLLATLFSAAVGLFFGIYPANRAAGLEPVEALRTE